MLAPLIVLSSLLYAPAVAASPPGPPDPMAPGAFSVSTIEYDAGVTAVQASGPIPYPYTERLRGTITLPTQPTGPLPVVLLLHGRHEACRAAGMDVSAGPVLIQCPDAGPVTQDLPSWHGYSYIAENLATHGYLVMSINANAVNVVGFLDGTRERSALIAGSLGLLSEWNQGARLIPDGVGDTLVGRVDLGRIGLMGHSRGADAVGYFLLEEQTRSGGPRFPGLRAVLEMEGVDIAGANQAPAGVHFGTILGSCDADPGTNGVRMWERGRFAPAGDAFSRVLFFVNGANHNFFNSEWYDEWTPPPTQPLPLNPYSDNVACSADEPTNIRLTRADQERVGLALVASFFRRYVGDEAALDPYMTGEALLPPSACPTQRLGAGAPLPCDRVLRTSYLAPAASRRMVLEPGDGDLEKVRGSGPVTLSLCTACPEKGNGSIARQLTVAWTGPARLSIPIDAGDLSSFDALTFRAAMNPSSLLNNGVAEQQLFIGLVDRDGDRVEVPVAEISTALERPLKDDGTPYQPPVAERNGYRSIILNGVRLPVARFEGVDLSNISEILLRLQGTGSIQLAELVLQG